MREGFESWDCTVWKGEDVVCVESHQCVQVCEERVQRRGSWTALSGAQH